MKITSLRAERGLAGFLFKYVWGTIVVILAFVPLVFLNLMQFPSLLILPFSRRIFRAYNRLVALSIWGWWAWGIKYIIGVDIIVTGDDLPRKENAIVIANHQSMADILIILCIALDKGCITFSTWMAKDILKYVPGLGWGLAFLDTIFLKRHWSRDAETIRATFKKITDNNVPIWLISFPEGTRMTPEKQTKNLQFVQKHGKPVTHHVLLPRPRGFSASTMALREHVKAVYSLTLGFEKQTPTLIEVIRGDIPRIHVHVKRYPIADVPDDRRANSDWLQQDFVSKDVWLGELYDKTRPKHQAPPTS